MLPRILMRMAAQAWLGPQNSQNGDPSSTSDDPYLPTVDDVIDIKQVLFSQKLPVELIDIILDIAEYWPHSTQATRFDQTPSGHLMIAGSSSRENRLLLRCCPLGFTSLPGSPVRPNDYLYGALPTSKLLPLSSEYDPTFFARHFTHPNSRSHPCRKIVFRIESSDQGWASVNAADKGTFRSSFTWFEAGLERFQRDDSCTDGCSGPFDKPPTPPHEVVAGSPPPPPFPIHSRVSQQHTNKLESLGEGGEGGDDNGGEGSSSGVTPPATLSLCHLRPVIPPVRPLDVPEPDAGLHGPITTSPHSPASGSSADDERYRYDFELLANEERTIQKNKTAYRPNGSYEIVWRHTDSVPGGSDKGPRYAGPALSDSQEGSGQIEGEAAVNLAAKDEEDRLKSLGRGGHTGNGEFVRGLKLGDVVTVWGKARFPGWTNHVEKVEVDIYWAV